MKNKFLNIVCGLISIAIIGISCEKDPQYREFNYPAPVPSGLSPASGYPMINVTITGTNLDTLNGAVKVWFGGIQATNIVSSNGNQIVVQVPSNAVSGKVSLQVWTHKVDSIGTYTVMAPPVINSVASQNAKKNVAFPGDTILIKGIRFGTDVSKAAIKFNQTLATDIPFFNDTLIKVIAPSGFSSGNVTFTMGGLTLIATPPIINPDAPGNITPYFLNNTGDTTKGGGFTYTGSLVSNRWGTLAAPWVTNAAAKNKSGVGGYTKDGSGSLCWETWGNTPVADGIVYQPTSMALPAGSYTFSFNYYAEVQTNSTVYGVVAAGGNGIPVLADLGTALASAKCFNGTAIGATAPNKTETISIPFTLPTSQVVSIGFLGNLAGAATQGAYFKVAWIKLVKH